MRKISKVVSQVILFAMMFVTVHAADTAPVTMNFDRTDIRTVLNILGQMKPEASLVIDEGIEGEVTVNIKDVPWEKAMELVLKPRGYVLLNEGGNIYRVTKKQVAAPVVSTEQAKQASDDIDLADQSIGLEVAILSPEELDNIPVNKARELLGLKRSDSPLPEVEIRKQLKDSLYPFVKMVKSQEQPASAVIRALAEAAGVSYSISNKYEKSTYQETVISDKDAADNASQEEKTFEEGIVNLTIKNSTIESAFEVIADQGGYQVRIVNGIWKFLPAPMDQREPLSIDVFEVKYLKVNEELLASISGGLTKRGSLKILGKKSILVKDTDAAIQQVRKILATIDKPIAQVQVEVRFFEINRDNRDEIGFNWKTMLLDDGIKMHTRDWFVNGTWDIDSASYPGNIDGALLTIEGLDPILKALKQSGAATQLSNPKIVVASGEQATVHIGDQIPMVKEESEQDQNGNVTTTVSLDDTFGGEKAQAFNLLEDPGSNVSPQRATYTGYLDVGTILTVAPSVKSEEDVYVKIVPELLAADFDSTEAFIKDENGVTIKYPKLSKTTVYTEFMLKSGQTAAIGGLVKDETTEIENKVPLLGDIPYLGSIFTYKATKKTKKEVLIFVTVKIVDTKQLDATAGVPSKAEYVQEQINEVRELDRNGAQYTDKEVKKDAPKRPDLIDIIPDTIDKVKELSDKYFYDNPAPVES
jgi:type II secretory pathway component GspD/PulD (secretin)